MRREQKAVPRHTLCVSGHTEQPWEQAHTNAPIASGHLAEGRSQEYRQGTTEEEDLGCSVQKHYTEQPTSGIKENTLRNAHYLKE